MLEKNIEKAVCEYAHQKGILVYKFTSPNRAAVPDRIFIAEGGKVFFIEFKATGKQMSVAQVRERNNIMLKGVEVFVVDDIDRGKHVIDMMINK